MMRIYITGSRGFVGRAVLQRLLAQGHQITILRRSDDSLESILRNLEVDAKHREKLRIHTGDLSRPSSIAGSLQGHDTLIHLAGAVGYGQDAKQCEIVNVEGTHHVLNEAIASGVTRLIHMSTVAVYGRRANQALDEQSPTCFTGDPYGDSKIRAEHLVQCIAAPHRLRWTILRPPVIYGPGDDKFLPKLIENLRHPHARYIGSADHPINLIHVDDVVDFIELCLRDDRTHDRIYNLDQPKNPSWRRFIQQVCTLHGLPPPQGNIPYFAAYLLAGLMEYASKWTHRNPRLTRYSVRVVGRHYDYRCDRAMDLGYRPKIEVEQGLRTCLPSSISASRYVK